ncbi:hypothetical protein sos41_32430 [Alphaproteobacteria bacterium SO-S41]|nr:hypothetical protein sos41_32430 [Alphaproteobacteria bacterium SO-S41]
MRGLKSVLVSATALALAQVAGAAEAAKAAEPVTMNCGAPIAWDATEDTLKKQYGAENIVHKDVGGPEGSELFASVVNEKTPETSFIVVWQDDEKRANPQTIMVNAIWDEESGAFKGAPVYASDEGLKVGMSIEEVEKLNGKPFKLSGFGWDYGGSPQSFEGGKLQQAEDTKCWLAMTFTTTAEKVPDSVLGETDIMSNAKDVLAAKPVVAQFTLNYMRPDAEPAPQ